MQLFWQTSRLRTGGSRLRGRLPAAGAGDFAPGDDLDVLGLEELAGGGSGEEVEEKRTHLKVCHYNGEKERAAGFPEGTGMHRTQNPLLQKERRADQVGR